MSVLFLHKDALYDTLALDSAVDTAKSLTNPAETLIVVTADHGHVFSFAQYQSRTNPIFHAADLSKGRIPTDFPAPGSFLFALGTLASVILIMHVTIECFFY